MIHFLPAMTDDVESSNTPPVETTGSMHILPAMNELRFACEGDMTIKVTLREGTAELFGTELAMDHMYTFTNCKVGIFTWHGCKIELIGKPSFLYMSNETPMCTYVNLHIYLEQERTLAVEGKRETGPRLMIVGPIDVGKSTLSRLMLNYAVRKQRKPLFVDLDIGQGSITVPGALSALQVMQPVDIEEGFCTAAPLAMHFGEISPSTNLTLYKISQSNLAKLVDQRCKSDTETNTAGLIINTCGWVEDLGYKLLLESINVFRPSIVCVLDQDRLYNDLSKARLPGAPAVVKLPKSGGVIQRDRANRSNLRSGRVREYFYGATGELSPHAITVPFNFVEIYRIGGGPTVPQSALPIGAVPVITKTQLNLVVPGPEILNVLLAVSNVIEKKTDASSGLSNLLTTNIAGFVVVTAIDAIRKEVTLLAPSPGPLHRKYLLVTAIKYVE